MTNEGHPAEENGTSHKFGTFAGVFTPSILTILGVIMFLRTGFIVGQAGITGSVLILLVCEIIVLLTALSISAIATNTVVRGGGAYYLISRVLGAEFGGSIGLALFFAQALSVPFYILGFTEALVDTFPGLVPYFRMIALATAALLFFVNRVGSHWAMKIQFLVMVVLALSIISFLGGAAMLFDTSIFQANLQPVYEKTPYSFWAILAIYFPAVTGIMAGVNMSGDLKDPARSLVRGTFAAIVVGFFVYLLEIVLSGGSQSRADLIERPYSMLVRNALWGTSFLVVAGVFAATLSSAIGSYLGAPRVLQALARDRIFTILKPFARGAGRTDEPHRALWLTFGLATIVLFLASGKDSRDSFNHVASIVTMFFLCTYMMVNMAAFVESVGANPSFRPRFKFFHWSTALVGMLGCGAIMLLIDFRAALLAVVIIAILYYRISRWLVSTNFGDARRGFLYAGVAKNLLRLRQQPMHAKNWRPTILALSGHPETRLTLLRYSVWFEAGHGILSLLQMIGGDLEDVAERRRAAIERLNLFIEENGLAIFPEVVVSPSFDEGIRLLLQAYSIEPIKPNLISMGWPSEPNRIQPFVRHLRDIALLGKSSLVVVDHGLPSDTEVKKRIDIWWRGKENGSLMLILAHLLTRNVEWDNARIRILRQIANEGGREDSRIALDALVASARIEAEIVIVVSEEPFEVVLKMYSRGATVVFLGFIPPTEEEAEAFHATYEKLLAHTPTVILISSSGEADLLA